MVVDTMRSGATGKDKWQAKSLRSTFGNQCMSQLPTSPSCGFGSAIREATDRVGARWPLSYRLTVLSITCAVLCCCFRLLHRTNTSVCSSPWRSECCCGCADICFTRCGQSKLPIKRRQQLSRSHLQSAGRSTCQHAHHKEATLSLS